MYIDKSILSQFVKESSNISQIRRKLLLANSSKSHKTIHKYIEKYNLDTSHFHKNYQKQSKQPIENYLVENKECSSSRLKKRLVDEGFLIDICNECSLKPIWNGKQITLQLDHINGIHDDNRLENLRILCPNCHSQTETFSSRNNKVINHCTDCNKEINRFSKRCSACFGKFYKQPTKIKWPNINTLIELVKNSNYLQVSKELGVSDTSIRKHLQKHYHNYGKHIDLKTFIITDLIS